MNHVFVRSGSLEEETELAKRTFEETLALCDEDEYPGDFGGEWRPVEMTMIFKNDTEISVDGVKIPAQHFNTVHSDLAVQVALQKEETEKLREELKKVSQKYDELVKRTWCESGGDDLYWCDVCSKHKNRESQDVVFDDIICCRKCGTYLGDTNKV